MWEEKKRNLIAIRLRDEEQRDVRHAAHDDQRARFDAHEDDPVVEVHFRSRHVAKLVFVLSETQNDECGERDVDRAGAGDGDDGSEAEDVEGD